MELELQRKKPVGQATPGQLFVDRVPECGTLEDLVRADPNPSTPQNEGKIYGETAIPAGRYRVILLSSKKFGPDTLSLVDVPGFTDIRIHAGNTPADSLGCIMVGKVAGGVILGGTSAPALAKLKAKVLAAILARREQVYITVRDFK